MCPPPGIESSQRVFILYLYLGWQYLVEHIGVVAKGHARVGRALVDVDVFVDVYHILSLGVYLHQHLLLAANHEA